MKLLWFGPTSDEIDEAARELIARHGTGASDEALRLSEVCRTIGATKKEKLYRLAAHKSAILLAKAKELANWRRGGEAPRATVVEFASLEAARSARKPR